MSGWLSRDVTYVPSDYMKGNDPSNPNKLTNGTKIITNGEKTEDQDDCKKNCILLKGCKYISYNTHTNQCWFYKDKTDKFTKPNDPTGPDEDPVNKYAKKICLGGMLSLFSP